MPKKVNIPPEQVEFSCIITGFSVFTGWTKIIQFRCNSIFETRKVCNTMGDLFFDSVKSTTRIQYVIISEVTHEVWKGSRSYQDKEFTEVVVKEFKDAFLN